MKLEVRSLGASRGFATLFRDVSFTVASGELLAVRGANGSGKTTLLRCIAGLTRADQGEVHRAGALLYAGHLAALQDDLDARANLAFLLAVNDRPATAGAIDAALAEVGLSRQRFLPARRLSAGQRKRVSLARLSLDPAPLWILDEPLAALDAEGEALLGVRLAAHRARGGLAVVATHHDLPAPASQEVRL